ncbi:HD domain-containing protein [Kribbella amoyensis]|uniref:HD domain-containing protein n=1 Tax=Kribbella amoyensis TaxID=996641 RepID=A0A561BL53_9ACTN|nr:HD domain-containing phosphohydrolase [Kribbella amoyensis]TWD79610.1 HD domain-containing protein [Kribbella amoyensis]
MARDDLRLAELLCALSVSLDLAMAQPLEKSIRSCLVALRLAQRLGLPPPTQQTTYYATLLRHLGCTATTHEEARLFGPGAAELRPLLERIDPARKREALPVLRQVGRGTGLHRLQYVGRAVVGSGEAQILLAVCEVGSILADGLGLGPEVSTALYQNLERFDGAGTPRGLAADEIAVATRIAEVATQAVIYQYLGGPDAVVTVLGRRAGGWLDPDVVAAYDEQLTEDLDTIDVWQEILEAEPGPVRRIPDDRIDAVAETFAHFVDLKSPYLLGHSTGVAELVDAAAVSVGIDDPRTVRRAALLHDLGRVAVPTGVWERPRELRRTDWEQVRLHPYQSERILARSAVLEPVADLVALHHERLDGSGYPRHAKAGDLPVPARLLAVADVYQALTQERPHRPAYEPDAAALVVLAEVAAGRLDGDCAKAVLGVAGHQVPGHLTSRPAGLSEREVEVLRLLARGRANAEIARELVVSPRTAEHHVQHIYGKIGVSTRAGAALFALRNGLFTP